MLRLALITIVCGITLAAWSGALRADIFRWDNGQLIPGTQGVSVEPGMVADGLKLHFADFAAEDLASASFKQTDLTHASLEAADLTDADFAGAMVTHALFDGTTARGFTQEQLATIVGEPTAPAEETLRLRP